MGPGPCRRKRLCGDRPGEAARVGRGLLDEVVLGEAPEERYVTDPAQKVAPALSQPCLDGRAGRARDTEPVAQTSREASTASGESPSVAGGGEFRRPARGVSACGEAASRS